MAGTRKAKAGGSVARKARASPWWLAADDEECAHCGQGYAYESEVRCAACDEPMCALCASRKQGVAVCPDCAGSG